MKINIYQINSDRDEKRLMFFDLFQIEKLTGDKTVRAEIYDKIFSGDVDCKNLESVYQKFNFDHPKGYTGRSLSVSDVVEVIEDSNVKKGYYFCDTVGFKKIDFEAEKAQDKVKDNQITVLYVQVGKQPVKVSIDNSLEAMQQLVGGYIEEYMPFKDEVAIVCNADGKLAGLRPNRAIYSENTETEVPSYAELKRIFMAAERAGKHLTAHITFTADSFNKPYSEQSRTYEVSSHNKAYWSKHLGLSIFGSCLDGTDQRVNLDAYMAEEHGGADGWKVEKCSLVTSDKEIADVIVGDFFIVRSNVEAEKYESLPKELMEKYSEKFKYPERFYKQNGQIKAYPIKPKDRDVER